MLYNKQQILTFMSKSTLMLIHYDEVQNNYFIKSITCIDDLKLHITLLVNESHFDFYGASSILLANFSLNH